jgi:hypothetical protein
LKERVKGTARLVRLSRVHRARYRRGIWWACGCQTYSMDLHCGTVCWLGLGSRGRSGFRFQKWFKR